VVIRLKRPGRVGVVLVAVALSRAGSEFEVSLAGVSSGRERVGFAVAAVASLVDPPAAVCARALERRVGVDMVFCVEVFGLVLALKSRVAEDDGPGVEAAASRRERLLSVDDMFGEFAWCRC